MFLIMSLNVKLYLSLWIIKPGYKELVLIKWFWFLLISSFNYQSISLNLIYGIHCSYYSLTISLALENLFILFFLHFWYVYSNVLPYIYFSFNYSSYSTLFIITTLLFSMWLVISLWLVDYFIESFIALTTIEQLGLIVGIKLLLVSELMLFFACFWCYINFRSIGSILLLFYFPLCTCYSFSIPFFIN